MGFTDVYVNTYKFVGVLKGEKINLFIKGGIDEVRAVEDKIFSGKTKSGIIKIINQIVLFKRLL